MKVLWTIREVIDAFQANIISKDEARVLLDVEALIVKKANDGTMAMSFDSKEVTVEYPVEKEVSDTE
jgi:hypothetical protein